MFTTLKAVAAAVAVADTPLTGTGNADVIALAAPGGLSHFLHFTYEAADPLAVAATTALLACITVTGEAAYRKE